MDDLQRLRDILLKTYNGDKGQVATFLVGFHAGLMIHKHHLNLGETLLDLMHEIEGVTQLPSDLLILVNGETPECEHDWVLISAEECSRCGALNTHPVFKEG